MVARWLHVLELRRPRGMQVAARPPRLVESARPLSHGGGWASKSHPDGPDTSSWCAGHRARDVDRHRFARIGRRPVAVAPTRRSQPERVGPAQGVDGRRCRTGGRWSVEGFEQLLAVDPLLANSRPWSSQTGDCAGALPTRPGRCAGSILMAQHRPRPAAPSIRAGRRPAGGPAGGPLLHPPRLELVEPGREALLGQIRPCRCRGGRRCRARNDRSSPSRWSPGRGRSTAGTAWPGSNPIRRGWCSISRRRSRANSIEKSAAAVGGAMAVNPARLFRRRRSMRRPPTLTHLDIEYDGSMAVASPVASDALNAIAEAHRRRDPGMRWLRGRVGRSGSLVDVLRHLTQPQVSKRTSGC